MGIRSRWILFILLMLPAVLAGHDEAPKAGEWHIWAPRAEIRPTGIVLGDGQLILASTPVAFGGWTRRYEGFHPGDWVRFAVEYRGEGLTEPRNQVLVRLEWKNARGERVGEPEFAGLERELGGWRATEGTVQAPSGAHAADLQLYVYRAGEATVAFRNPVVVEVPAPSKRPVRIAAINYRPAKARGGEENARQLADFLARELQQPADLIVLGEGVTVVGSSKKYEDVAEAANGPTARILGEVARARHSWLVAGIYERDGANIFNTAILLNREGKLAGKYRKVYLPREEVERGLAPGDDWPVFQTDFGKLGLMICYDVFFADPANALALGGAEVIAMPIWGGNETLAKARSIEGRVFLVAAGYDHPTYIQDPNGERLATATKSPSIAWVEVDLARPYREEFLGDMRARRSRETRRGVGLNR